MFINIIIFFGAVVGKVFNKSPINETAISNIKYIYYSVGLLSHK